MFQPGEQIGPYVVRRSFGTSRVAERYEVEHGVTGVRHHVVVLRVESGTAPPQLVRQFGLKHPNLVGVNGVVDAVGFLALVTEPFDGAPLTEAMPSTDSEQAMQIFRDVLHGVLAAHDAGVLHLDIHPENILVGSSPYGGLSAKVAGFYLAKMVEDQDRGSRQVFSRFAAPEMFTDDAHAGIPADVFSLGALLYEMLSGQAAFDGDVVSSLRQRGTGSYLPLSEVAPDCRPQLVAAVDKALRPDPADRFQTCLSFGRAVFGDSFEPIPADRSLSVSPSEPTASTPPARSRTATPIQPIRPEEERVEAPLPAWTILVVFAFVGCLAFVALTYTAIGEINAAERATHSAMDAVEAAMSEREEIVDDLVRSGGQQQVLERALQNYASAPPERMADAAADLRDVLRNQLVVMSAEGSADALGAANRVDRSLDRIDRSLQTYTTTVMLWESTARGWRGKVLSALGLIEQPSEEMLAITEPDH